MAKLPLLTAKQLVRLLEKRGFKRFRQKGGHLIMVNEKEDIQVVVPIHGRDIKKGTLYSIIKQDVDDYIFRHQFPGPPQLLTPKICLLIGVRIHKVVMLAITVKKLHLLLLHLRL